MREPWLYNDPRAEFPKSDARLWADCRVGCDVVRATAGVGLYEGIEEECGVSEGDVAEPSRWSIRAGPDVDKTEVGNVVAEEDGAGIGGVTDAESFGKWGLRMLQTEGVDSFVFVETSRSLGSSACHQPCRPTVRGLGVRCWGFIE